MNDLPLKLPKYATLTVWGCPTLTIGERLIWFHDWDLDVNPKDRSYIGCESMSKRLGGYMKWKAVEQTRGRLRRFGLHVSFVRPEGRNLGWVSTLPPQFIGRNGKHAIAMISEFSQYILERDIWIKRRDGRPPDVVQTEASQEVGPSDRRRASRQIRDGETDMREGGKGGGPLQSSTLSETQLLSAFEEIEVGDVADATDQKTGARCDGRRHPGEATSAWLARIAADSKQGRSHAS